MVLHKFAMLFNKVHKAMLLCEFSFPTELSKNKSMIMVSYDDMIDHRQKFNMFHAVTAHRKLEIKDHLCRLPSTGSISSGFLPFNGKDQQQGH